MITASQQFSICSILTPLGLRSTFPLFFCSFFLLSFRETCSLSKKKKTKREEVSEKRIQEEYEKLGAIR